MPAYDSSVQYKTATIANGATTSDAVDCGQNRAARLSMPAAFTGTSLGVQVLASDGSTYQTLYDDSGVAYAITVAAGREVILNMIDFLGIQSFKLVSNAAEGAERAIGVVLIP
jgi:hypothetical protein